MIGERLAELRKDKGLNQQDLADALGLSLSAISSYERDVSSPDDEVKIKLAQMFNISLDYLIGSIDEEIPLIRKNRIDLPDGFPVDYLPVLQDLVSLIMFRHKAIGTKNKCP